MIWNAVPVEFARNLAQVIYNDIQEYLTKKDKNFSSKNFEHKLEHELIAV